MTATYDENILELISAAVDGEASEFELYQIMKAVNEKPELLRHWQMFSLMGDIARKESWQKSSLALIDSVTAAIASEPSMVSSKYQMYQFAKPLSKIALAASVAVAVVVGVDVYTSNTEIPSPSIQAQNSAPPIQNTDITPVAFHKKSEPTFEVIRDERLDAYLKRHAEMNAPHDMLPYVRIVSQSAE